MSADVEKCAEYIVVIADCDDGFSTNIGRDILPGFLKLIVPAGKVPVIGEYSSQFEIVEIFVDVPRCGNGVSPIERRVWIVRVDDSLEVVDHGDLRRTEGISLRHLCVLCVSAVDLGRPLLKPQRRRERRDNAENLKLASLSFFSD